MDAAEIIREAEARGRGDQVPSNIAEQMTAARVLLGICREESAARMHGAPELHLAINTFNNALRRLATQASLSLGEETPETYDFMANISTDMAEFAGVTIAHLPKAAQEQVMELALIAMARGMGVAYERLGADGEKLPPRTAH